MLPASLFIYEQNVSAKNVYMTKPTQETHLKTTVSEPFIKLPLIWVRDIICNDLVIFSFLVIMLLNLFQMLANLDSSQVYNAANWMFEAPKQNSPSSTALNFTLEYSTELNLVQQYNVFWESQLNESYSNLIQSIQTLKLLSSNTSTQFEKILDSLLSDINSTITENLIEQNDQLVELSNNIANSGAFISSSIGTQLTNDIPLNYTWIQEYLARELDNGLQKWIGFNESTVATLLADVKEIYSNTAIQLQKLVKNWNNDIANVSDTYNIPLYADIYSTKESHEESLSRPSSSATSLGSVKTISIVKLTILIILVPLMSIFISLYTSWIQLRNERQTMNNIFKLQKEYKITDLFLLINYSLDIHLLHLINLLRYRKSFQTFHKELIHVYKACCYLFGFRSTFKSLLKAWWILLVLSLSISSLFQQDIRSEARELTSVTATTQNHDFVVSFHKMSNTFTNILPNDDSRFQKLSNSMQNLNQHLYSNITSLLSYYELQEFIVFNNTNTFTLMTTTNEHLWDLATSSIQLSSEQKNFTTNTNLSFTTIAPGNDTTTNSRPSYIGTINKWNEQYMRPFLIILSLLIACIVSVGILCK